MDNRPDIWRRLQDHQMPPPPGAFDRLQHALPAPEDDTPGRLKRLQQRDENPPAFIRLSINQRIAGSPTGHLRRMRPTRFFYAVTAACFILLTGLTIYKTIFSHKPPPPATQMAIAHPPPAAADGKPFPDSAFNRDTVGTAAALAAHVTDSINPTLTATAATEVRDHPYTLFIDTHPLPLVDNDLFVTLTSFKYPEVAAYVGKGQDQTLKVHLDQYTNIFISRQVAGMIKQMYETRPNGKPTRKARKMKERLDGWKKADEKRFDSTATFNPTDPIDLGDFIFK